MRLSTRYCVHVYVSAEIHAMPQFMDSLSCCLYVGCNASVHVYVCLSLMCVGGGGGGGARTCCDSRGFKWLPHGH